MKKLFCNAKSIFLIAVLCVSLCGCPISERSSVKGTIHKFEHACHKLDIDEMLECVEPTIAKLFNILPIPKDKESRSEFLLNIIDFIYVIDADSANEVMDFFESVHIKVNSVDVGERRATVEAELHYKIDGVKSEDYIIITLLERGNEWYIASIY